MKLLNRIAFALVFSPLLSAQIPFQTDALAMSPLGFWPLYGNANDVSGHGNAGALNGLNFTSFVGPLSTLASPAAVFSSSISSIVALPVAGSSSFNLGGTHALTAMAWVRTENSAIPLMWILGKVDPAVNTGWVIGIDNGGIAAPFAGGRFGLFFAVGGKITLAVESTLSVNDGGWHLVAATYDGSGSASGVRLYIDGVGLASTIGTDSIGSGSILNSGPFTIGAAPDQANAFEGNINDAAVFGVALTPAQHLQLANDVPQFKRILPQLAFGGGWYSAIYLTNGGTSTVSFPVNFIGENGAPLNIPSIGSSTTITLAPGTSTVIEAPNVGSLTQGYVSMILPIGILGYGVFRQSVAGSNDQEGVVPLSVATAGFASLLFDETNFITGVAIVNPSAVATTVTITAVDSNGVTVGTSSLALPALNKTAIALRSLPGLSQIAGKRGTVQFTIPAQTTAASTGNVAVLGLRFNGLAFTSIPAFGRPGI